MAKNTVRIDSDSRSRYEHQAYDVTYGGKSKETGALGPDRRLSATYEANFQVSLDVSTTGTYQFLLPPFIYSNGFLVVESGGGSPIINLTMSLPDGNGAYDLAQNYTIAAVTNAKVPYDFGDVIEVVPFDQMLTVEVTSAGTGVTSLVIPATILQTSWK